MICDIDDILISGKTKQEHRERLDLVLSRLEEAGVTLNQKCQFELEEVKFIGNILNKDGVKIDPEKVEAITKMSSPKSITELRRFMGMVNHLGKFTPNLAEKTKPMRELLKRKNEWSWNIEHEEAFQKVKKLMIEAPTLAHYDVTKETRVSSDASKNGLGAVLLQKHDEWKPVFCTSR